MARRWVVLAVGLWGCSAVRLPPRLDPEPTLTVVSTDRLAAKEPSWPAEPPATLADASLPSSTSLTPAPGSEGRTEPAGLDSESDLLAIVADCLERGDRTSAARGLETYVRRHPDQPLFRAQLAELYVQLGRDHEARYHFQRFVALTPATNQSLRAYRVHAYTRLMELAQRRGDRFAEEYHRGLGLIALLEELDDEAGHDPGLREEVWCQAVRALRQAEQLKPGYPGLSRALAEVYNQVGNDRAAALQWDAARRDPWLSSSRLPPLPKHEAKR